MSLYAIGDLHLHFQAELKARGQLTEPVWRDHEARFRENCERTVRPEDTLVLIGDKGRGEQFETYTGENADYQQGGHTDLGMVDEPAHLSYIAVLRAVKPVVEAIKETVQNVFLFIGVMGLHQQCT